MQTKTKEAKQKSMPKSQSNLSPAAAAAVVAMVASSKKMPPGARVKYSSLRTQAGVSYGLGVTHDVEMTPGGWSPQENAGLKSDDEALDASYRKFNRQREQNAAESLKYKAVVADCTSYRRRLITAFKIATQGDANPLVAERLHIKTTKSGKEMGVWFELVIAKVETHKAALQTVLGSDPVALTAAYSAKLKDAVAVYQQNRQLIPAMSAEQKAARVKLAASIERQRLVAEIVFQGNESVLKQFVPIWKVKSGKKASAAAGSEQAAATAAPAEAAAAERPVEAEASKTAQH